MIERDGDFNSPVWQALQREQMRRAAAAAGTL
jgi:hypothetical protein